MMGVKLNLENAHIHNHAHFLPLSPDFKIGLFARTLLSEALNDQGQYREAMGEHTSIVTMSLIYIYVPWFQHSSFPIR